MHEHHHDAGDYTEMLDLDAVVLADYWSDVTSWVADAGPTAPVRRIVDLGSGAGTATYAFGERFPHAELVPVDVSQTMLDHLVAGAHARTLQDRVHPVLADLDGAFPDLGTVDLAWASMSLHHMADPDRVLTELAATVRPGGAVAVAEFADPLRFLPDAAGNGVEERLLDVLADTNAHMVAHMASDWSARLAAAGLQVIGQRAFTIDLAEQLPAAAGRYARLWFERLVDGIGDAIDADDRSTLHALVHGTGPDALGNRTDLHLRGVRTVTLARR